VGNETVSGHNCFNTQYGCYKGKSDPKNGHNMLTYNEKGVKVGFSFNCLFFLLLKIVWQRIKEVGPKGAFF